MTAWRERAACRGEDPELFFSDSDAGRDAARQVCLRCDVIDQCRADAERHGAYGIWAAEHWYAGDITCRRGPVAAAYPAEIRAQAVALFRELRPQYRTELAVCRLVATALGVSSPRTVRDWIVAEIPREQRVGKCGAVPQLAKRAAALAMFDEVRPTCPHDTAALKLVAAAHGVHAETARAWLREHQAAARQKVGAAA